MTGKLNCYYNYKITIHRSARNEKNDSMLDSSHYAENDRKNPIYVMNQPLQKKIIKKQTLNHFATKKKGREKCFC